MSLNIKKGGRSWQETWNSCTNIREVGEFSFIDPFKNVNDVKRRIRRWWCGRINNLKLCVVCMRVTIFFSNIVLDNLKFLFHWNSHNHALYFCGSCWDGYLIWITKEFIFLYAYRAENEKNGYFCNGESSKKVWLYGLNLLMNWVSCKGFSTWQNVVLSINGFENNVGVNVMYIQIRMIPDMWDWVICHVLILKE